MKTTNPVKHKLSASTTAGFKELTKVCKKLESYGQETLAVKDFIMPFGKYRGHTFSSVPHDPI